jgi:hypothetical protein
MAWRVARSLLVLRDQLNLAYPGRDKSADGTIGDTAHQAGQSDHNPDAAGVVRALDVTHDPAHGLDIGQLAEQLRASRDPRIKYVIANRRICSATVSPWQWRPYTGSDTHTGHMHLSVVADGRADDPQYWRIRGTTVPSPEEIDMATTDDIMRRLDGIAAATGVPGMGGVRNYEPGPLVDNMVPMRQGVDALLSRPAVTLDAQQLAAIASQVAAALGAKLDQVAADVDRLQAAQVAAGQAAAG